jgi:hypothetical protein
LATTLASDVYSGTNASAFANANIAIGTPIAHTKINAAFNGLATSSNRPSPTRLAAIACTPLDTPCSAA